MKKRAMHSFEINADSVVADDDVRSRHMNRGLYETQQSWLLGLQVKKKKNYVYFKSAPQRPLILQRRKIWSIAQRQQCVMEGRYWISVQMRSEDSSEDIMMQDTTRSTIAWPFP